MGPAMIVMVANRTGMEIGRMTKDHPGMLGHLYSPGAQRGPWDFLPYALDNGAFPAYENGIEWQEGPWRHLLWWAAMSGQRPLWALVPDVVANRENTIENWARFSPDVRKFGFRPAFALQDGMTFDDVPSDDCMLFIGGSTEWKLAAIRPWCARFPGRIHVGRVNTWDRLMLCYEAGASSVDGTRWFTKKGGQAGDLVRFFEYVASRKEAA